MFCQILRLDFFVAYHIYTSFILQKYMRILMLLLWLIFWSLGSVVMTRFSNGLTWSKLRGFFFGYSQCPQCQHRLHAKDLVPLMSYLVQWGKCRYCSKRIPRIYPVLELLSAWMFVASYFLLKDSWTPILVFWLLTNRLLLLLLVYDLQTYELHMPIWIFLALVWIVANIFLPQWNLRYAFLSALVFGGLFTAIYFFARRYAKMRFKQTMDGFGQGDVYLAISVWMFVPLILALSGMLFSWWMLANILILFILLSSILGLIRSVFQYIVWKLTRNSQPSTLNAQFHIIPFFPAMIIAFWLMAWKISFFISLLFPLAW